MGRGASCLLWGSIAEVGFGGGVGPSHPSRKNKCPARVGHPEGFAGCGWICGSPTSHDKLRREIWGTQIVLINAQTFLLGEELPDLEGADGFEEEPAAAFGLVDPDFEEAGGGDVVMVVGDLVGFAHVFNELEVVVVELGEHEFGGDEGR